MTAQPMRLTRAASCLVQIIFARMIITTAFSLLYMWWTKVEHWPLGPREVRGLLVARGLGGFFGVFGLYCK